MPDMVDWITIVAALVSGGAAGGGAVAVMRADIRTMRAELSRLRGTIAVIRQEQKEDAKECRSSIQQLLRMLAKPGNGQQ